MTVYALIEQETEGGVTASLIGWPAVTAHGATEAEALRELRRSIHDQLQQARIVPLEVELGEQGNPWLQLAGIFNDDPFASDLADAIAGYRRELDAQEESV